MFKLVLDELEGEVSGEIALGFVSEITRHHRIQASPGLRSAVKYAVETMKGFGLDAKVDEYQADGETYSWSSLHFKEWFCQEAELSLIEPEDKAKFLARWDESKLSLIQRSHPTPEEGVETEVVVLDKGEEEKDYKSVDVEGKLVLTNGDLGRVRELAVEERGALGIIFDGTWVRPPALMEGELDDALRYTSFWWAGDEKPCFGFVLTPRTGRWLRKLVEDRAKNKEVVMVRARVDSELYKGTIDNVLMTIPGETEEEIIVVAHICHPQPSANDNASGSGAAMEAARALNKLISEGRIERPKRTIRFMLVPEMTGTYNYLARNEGSIPNIIAALNLDMVGEKQPVTGGPLILERTPQATPSFVNSLMEAIYDVVKSEVGNLGGSAKYPLFMHAVTPFSGGSDHYIFSDPTVGVPCPMFIQWPDKFWHTSYDTLDKVDPDMLKRVALMAATYAYVIANAEAEEALWLVNEVATREKSRFVAQIQESVTEVMNTAVKSEDISKELSVGLSKIRRTIPYLHERMAGSVKSIDPIAGNDIRYTSTKEEILSELERLMRSERRRAVKTLQRFAEVRGLGRLRGRGGRLSKLEKEARAMVPRRLFRGPVSTRPWLAKLSKESREAWWRLGKKHENSRILGTLSLYWTDGEKDLLEISKLVELETGMANLEYIVNYFRLLGEMELIGLG